MVEFDVTVSRKGVGTIFKFHKEDIEEIFKPSAAFSILSAYVKSLAPDEDYEDE